VRWTRKSIVSEIRRLHEAGEELYYSKAEDNHLNLVRAAGWHFGTWRRAVEAAGVDYESLSRYERWNKKKIIERIKELHAQGQSLNWRSVSTEIDPPLAAAALRPNGFNSWREAIAAAGFKIESVARYQEWDHDKVIKLIRARKRAGLSMFSKSMQVEDQPLFCAARRRFGSWDNALNAAGLNADKIRLRKFNPALNAPRSKKSEAGAAKSRAVAANKPTAKKAAGKASNNGARSGQLSLDLKAPGKVPAKLSIKAGAKKLAAKQVAPAKAPAKRAAKKQAAPAKVAAKKVASAKASAKKAAKKTAAKKTAAKKTAARRR
jgi:hypothetical protein